MTTNTPKMNSLEISKICYENKLSKQSVTTYKQARKKCLNQQK